MIIFADPKMKSELEPYTPNPIGLWPMSGPQHTSDVLADKIPAKVHGAALDPMVPPTGFDGSVALSNLPHSNITIDLTKTKSRIPPSQWDGLTITLWIKPKEPALAQNMTQRFLMVRIALDLQNMLSLKTKSFCVERF